MPFCVDSAKKLTVHRYKGPTWEATDGSLVGSGAALATHFLPTVASAVHWLELPAKDPSRQFAKVTFIQSRHVRRTSAHRQALRCAARRRSGARQLLRPLRVLRSSVTSENAIAWRSRMERSDACASVSVDCIAACGPVGCHCGLVVSWAVHFPGRCPGSGGHPEHLGGC